MILVMMFENLWQKNQNKKTKQITRSGCYINITLGLKTHFFASLMKLKICKPVSSTIYLPLFPYYSTTILSIYRFLVCIITITLLPPKSPLSNQFNKNPAAVLVFNQILLIFILPQQLLLYYTIYPPSTHSTL